MNNSLNEIYKKVSSVIPEIEWKIHAPLIDKINRLKKDKNAVILAAPMFTNAGLITLYSTLAFTDSLPENKWAKTATFVLGATQVVDLFNHVHNTSPYSDSGKLIQYFQDHRGLTSSEAYWAVKGPQIGFAALGTAALVVEGVRIFTNEVPDPNNNNIRIVPSVSPTGGMLTVSGQF